MRRLLIIGLCCLCLCGCGKSFQASNFKWVKDGQISYAVGTIKNNSSTKCNDLEIKLVYKNGDIEEDGVCFPFLTEENAIQPDEARYVECMYTGDINNITDYDIEVVSVECFSNDF